MSTKNNLNFKNRKLLYNVGINDGDYVTQSAQGQRCPYYDRWQSMIRRCYSTKSKIKNPSYIDCTVQEEWKTFSNFKKWMENQYWKDLELDKDLLNPCSKQYSEINCIFVPNYINRAFSKVVTPKSLNDLPLGVHFKKSLKTNPYIAQGVKANTRIHLEVSSCPKSAHLFWQKWKILSLQECLNKYTSEDFIDIRIISILNKAIKKIESDISLNLITSSVLV